jgi:hypothetical protein
MNRVRLRGEVVPEKYARAARHGREEEEQLPGETTHEEDDHA